MVVNLVSAIRYTLETRSAETLFVSYMPAILKGRDPGEKLTLFDVFRMTAAIGGCSAGFVLGYKVGSWPGGIALGFCGLYLGTVIGRIPIALALKFLERDIRRCNTANLREKLTSQPYLSHFIVAELVTRGESERELQDHALSLLLSESGDVRWQGWRTVNLCFPALAESMRGIDVRLPPQRYEQLIQRLRKELGRDDQ